MLIGVQVECERWKGASLFWKLESHFDSIIPVLTKMALHKKEIFHKHGLNYIPCCRGCSKVNYKVNIFTHKT